MENDLRKITELRVSGNSHMLESKVISGRF